MKKVKITALIAALIVGIGIYFFLKEIGKPQETPRTEVVVAAVDIPENTLITAEMLELRPVATEALLENHLLDVKSAVGMISSGDIYAGEQIISDRLVRTGEAGADSNTLAYLVDNGMRAITLSVNSVTGLENMLKPGNRVDLILTYSEEMTSEDGQKTKLFASRFLMQNKKILAVSSSLGKEGAKEYTTVTLETTPEDTLSISFAECVGVIRLVLRSPIDNTVVDIGEVRTLPGREEVIQP